MYTSAAQRHLTCSGQALLSSQCKQHAFSTVNLCVYKKYTIMHLHHSTKYTSLNSRVADLFLKIMHIGDSKFNEPYHNVICQPNVMYTTSSADTTMQKDKTSQNHYNHTSKVLGIFG